MRRVLPALLTIAVAFSTAADEPKKDQANDPAAPAPASVLDFTMKDIDGNQVKLGDKFAGKVLLIVNTASLCGYTKQYDGLEAIYKQYHDKGLEVVAFPSNDFGAQEPGTDAEIKTFCSTDYKITFPLFSKIPVKGENQDPLYAYLTDKAKNPETGGEIKWNFTKFLVSRDGKVIARFESKVKPTEPDVTGAIEKALAQPAPKPAQ